MLLFYSSILSILVNILSTNHLIMNEIKDNNLSKSAQSSDFTVNQTTTNL